MSATMVKTPIACCMLGLAWFAAGVATGLVAQTLNDSPQRVERKRTDLLGAPGLAVIT